VPEHRGLVARFLHFYPQYELADLRTGGRLNYGEFMFLVAGMFDIEQPEATETTQERTKRKLHEMAMKNAGKRSGLQRR